MSQPSSRRLKLQLALGLGALIVAAATATAPSVAEPNKVEIDYQGELLDEKQQPLAGIYPLEFRLYNDTRSENVLWRELHWVAVADGRYNLRLGTTSPLRATLARPGAQMFLGINLANGGELVREAITFPAPRSDKAEEPGDKAEKPVEKPAEKPAEPADKAPAEPVEEKPGEPSRYRTESSFAEVADFAKRSGTAENAEKLNGRTLADLEAEIERLRDELARHRADQEAHGSGGGGGGKLGAQTTVLPRIGGAGGRPFTRECPPGYVVTGIRGGAGDLIDSIQLICSPLE